MVRSTATKLQEQFTFGITDPTDAAFAGRGRQFRSRSLAPFDLTAGGALLNYNQSFTVKQQAAYVAGRHQGRRRDVQARRSSRPLRRPDGEVAGASRGSVCHTPCRARAPSFARRTGERWRRRTTKTCCCRHGYGLNGLFGSGDPVPPGVRNQGELGVQQAFGRWLVADVGYFNKRTDNGYDFGVLFDTPIAFPVAWARSRIDGFTGRLNLVEHRGLQRVRRDGAHERDLLAARRRRHSARAAGGRFPDRPRSEVQRDDQPSVRLREAHRRVGGASAGGTIPVSSPGSVPDYATALTLTGDQQAAIGLFCGSTVATLTSPITSCCIAEPRRDACSSFRPTARKTT